MADDWKKIGEIERVLAEWFRKEGYSIERVDGVTIAVLRHDVDYEGDDVVIDLTAISKHLSQEVLS